MSHNPYAPPQALVADMGTTEVQALNPWSPSGRIGRLRYMAWLSAGYFVTLLGSGILGALGFAAGSPWVVTAGIWIITIPYLVLSLFWGIQRAHDMNWSGWTCLLAIIPFVALLWFFKGGSSGANRYGAPPPPNTTAVRILGGILPLLFLVGLLAAIALPAYQGYVKRAQAVQAGH